MSNPTELPDLDRLESLARAATPGEWNAQRHGCVVGGPMRKYVNGSAQAQLASFNVTFHDQDPDDELERQQANAEFCAAANPAAVLALLALARRAQPEGEAPQADAQRLEAIAARWDNDYVEDGPDITIGKMLREEFAAAFPAAQQAESGAQAMEADLLARDLDAAALAQDDKHLHGLLVRASLGIKALAAQSQGAPIGQLNEVIALLRQIEDCPDDGEPWVIAGKARLLVESLAAQQAAAPGALDADEMTRLRRLMKALGHADAFERDDAYARGVMCTVLGEAAGRIERAAAPSAPGTPEAPSDTERMDWLDQNIFHRGMDDLDAMQRPGAWMWVTFGPKGVQGTARSIIDAARAAQLDGGQGEGERA